MSEILLLGAGASCGSVRSGTRPPLGKDLYAELYRVSRCWRSIPNAATREFEGPGKFEQGFGWIRRHCDERSVPLLRDMALYFLAMRPRPDNLYVPMLEGVRRRGNVQLATLNYDLMIECCMMELFKLIVHGPTVQGEIGLLKLHGSPNLIPQLNGARIINCSFANNSGSAVSSNSYDWATPDEAESWIRSQQSLAPCMALYEAGKYVPIGGNAVMLIQNQFRDACAGATKIYVVGTSFQRHDAHVWEPIIQSDAKIIVADPFPDTFTALQNIIGSRLTIAPIDFSRFVQAYYDRNI